MGTMPSPADVTRRAFLAGTAAGLLAGAACRREENRAFPPPPPSSDVLLLAATGYDNLADLVARGLRELSFSCTGKRVLLKPNLVEFEPGGAINTHPQLVGAVAEAVRRSGARALVVAEGPGHRRDLEYLVTATGLCDILHELRVSVIDLNHDDVRRVPLRARFMGMDTLALPVSVIDADVIISMPKLKTHHWAGMTVLE